MRSASEITSSTIARSAFWRFLEATGYEGMAFVFMVLLARVLGPNDYGIVAMASVFVASCQKVLYSGVPDAVIQSDDASESFLDSAFWANMLLGSSFAVLFLVIAAPAAALVGEPKLQGVLIGLSPLPILSAATGIFQARLRRAMRFRTLALRTHVCVLSGGIAGIGLAFSGAGYWSLVAQQVTYALAGLVILVQESEWKPRLRIQVRQIRSFYRFSSQVSGRTLLDNLSQSGLPFIIGIFLPTQQVGLFSMARRVVFSFSSFTTASLSEIMLPVLSRLAHSPDEHRESVYMALRLACLLSVPTFLTAALIAEPMIVTLFGNTWTSSAACMQFLLLAGIFQALPWVSSQIFSSIAKPVNGLYISIAMNFFSMTLVFMLAPHGIEAAAAGIIIAYVGVTPITLFRLRRVLSLDLERLVREQAPIWVGSMMIGVIITLAMGKLSSPTEIILMATAVFALGFPTIAILSIPAARFWLATLGRKSIKTLAGTLTGRTLQLERRDARKARST